MERADIAGMENALRESFLGAAKDIEEKRTATGSAFFTSGHAIGQFETRANVLRARLWLLDKPPHVVCALVQGSDSGQWGHGVPLLRMP